MPLRAIARIVGRSVAAVSRVLAGLALSSLKALEPNSSVVRYEPYERQSPGELLHMDTKKLVGRIVRPSHRVTGNRRDSVDGAGWEFAHVTIDDHSLAGFVQMHADRCKGSAVDFLKAAVAHYAALGVRIQRPITDNGAAYRSRLFAQTCQTLGIKHSFTQAYRPQTNGNDKAERFIQTCPRKWAYGRVWANSTGLYSLVARLPDLLQRPKTALVSWSQASRPKTRREQPIATRQLGLSKWHQFRILIFGYMAATQISKGMLCFYFRSRHSL